MSLKNSFHPYALVTIVLWSLAYVFTRLALQYFSVFSLAFLRYLAASCVLLAAAVLTKMKPPRRRDLPCFFVSGGLGFFLYMIAFNTGQSTVTAATGSVIIATVPVITALLARAVYHERLGRLQWAAILIEFIGVAVLTLINGVFSADPGILWMFLAALSLSAYNLIQRRLTRSYTALQASTYSIFFGTLLLAVFAPMSFREAVHAPAVQYFYLAVLSLGPSAIAYVSWAKAFSKAKRTSQVSNYMFVTPFLTSVFGFLIAGEVPDAATLLGGGIMLAGVLLFNLGGTPSRQA